MKPGLSASITPAATNRGELSYVRQCVLSLSCFGSSIGEEGCSMFHRRMVLLLQGAGHRAFKSLPTGVGLKTVIEALDQDLIETNGEFHFRRIKCRITPKG